MNTENRYFELTSAINTMYKTLQSNRDALWNGLSFAKFSKYQTTIHDLSVEQFERYVSKSQKLLNVFKTYKTNIAIYQHLVDQRKGIIIC